MIIRSRAFSRSARLAASSSRRYVTSSALHDLLTKEPQGPSVQTELPGPKARAAREELLNVADWQSLNMILDYYKSYGNYAIDPDGNAFLDVFAQIASIPIGYNNPTLLAAATTPEFATYLMNRPAMGNFPPAEMAQILRDGILSVAPKGLNKVSTSMCGSCANETAYKAAFMYHARQKRGIDTDFTEDEVMSCMRNQAPGSPDVAILSFTGGFHGRLFGSLSTTRSKPIHKLDIPAFNWPQAPFPMLKYPLEEHVEENKVEEARCLQELERIIKECKTPIAAVVVEPIQSEGGDNHASPQFFQSLRTLTLDHSILLIVDEVQTGIGATGQFWAHEAWGLDIPPDVVTFSKKFQAAGWYYGREELQPDRGYRQFNTWMGDPVRALQAKVIIEEIRRLDLLPNVNETGNWLYEQLEDRFGRKGLVRNLRGKGRGTYIAWDMDDGPTRDKFVVEMKKRGVNIGGCGERAVRLRPMLVFTRRHAEVLVGVMEDVLNKA